MTGKATTAVNQSQSDKFKQAARELEADEDEGRWEQRLKRIAKAKAEASGTK
jgi:hypothetical protein